MSAYKVDLPALERRLEHALNELAPKFLSGNQIPVERASVLREEFLRIVVAADELRDGYQRVMQDCLDSQSRH